MAAVQVDVSEWKEFSDRMSRAAKGEFKKELNLFLEGVGNEFLRIVEDEIVRREVVDTRLLLLSFHKGSDDGVWILDYDGLTLEVGTNIEYAKYVNDGHWLNPKGVNVRWVPGYWRGHSFVYDPTAKTGMALKQKWIKGKPYFQSALKILDKMFPEYLEKRLQQWLNDYFEL